MASTRIYQAVPGRGSAFLQHVRLYLGLDHLLQVTSNGFTESYKRCFYEDIQAVILVHTVAGKVTNAVLAGLAAVLAATGFAAGGDGLGVCVVLVTFLLVLLAINVILGPTCTCYIKTAVQTQKLPSLRRVRRVRRFVALLRPRLALAQGEMAPDEIGDRLERAVQSRVYGGQIPPAADG